MKFRFNIYSFKLFIKKFVTVFSSREFAFIYCLLGTLGQIFHTYYLIHSVSSFDGWARTLQAVILSVFISSALMYFVSIADKDDDQNEYKRIMRAVNLFMYIEILINLYYYCNHLIIISTEMRIFDFLFGSVVSGLIPISIKLFANSIKAKQWLQEIENKNISESESTNIIQNDPISEQLIDSIFNDLQNRIETHIDSKMKYIDEHVQSVLKEKLQSQNLDDLIGNYSIDHELIKSNIKSELKEYIDKNIKSKSTNNQEISLEELDKLYHQDIMTKIEELVDKHNGEFLKKIETNIDEAIKKYMNNNKSSAHI